MLRPNPMGIGHADRTRPITRPRGKAGRRISADHVRKRLIAAPFRLYLATMAKAEPGHEGYYRAMLARDPRFDGKFFVGVKTTGIYCRPICPARPKRENVEFFRDRFAAERAGYRPCLRCRPEAAPLSPAWAGAPALVRRAVRAIQAGEAAGTGEEDFARRFGVGARHLRRLFMAELGKTPKQLALEGRLSLARKLITETRLPLADAARAAGFASVRRFNSAFRERFRRAPSALRRQPSAPDAPLRLFLPYRPPLDFAGLLASYRAHRIGELEEFTATSMRRVVSCDGKLGVITITDDPGGARLAVEADLPDLSRLPAILARIRRLFDLDADPAALDSHFGSAPRIRALWERHPGIRLPSGWDGFEVAVGTILGQLVSVDRARRLVSDLIDMLGEDTGSRRDGRPIKFFPAPASLARADLRGLGTTQARKRTVIAFARAVADGALSLEPAQDVDAFIAKVRAIPGIGPWTSAYMALKVLGHADAFPGTDLVLSRALKLHGPAAIEALRPWRGYAAALFWRAYAGTDP